MHPLDLMNKAFVAASVAEKDGFFETAKAFRDIALEAFVLMQRGERTTLSTAHTKNSSRNLKLLASNYS